MKCTNKTIENSKVYFESGVYNFAIGWNKYAKYLGVVVLFFSLFFTVLAGLSLLRLALTFLLT